MGRDKAFLTLDDGTTLVAHQAALLRALPVNDLLISAQPQVDYGVPGAHRVYDLVPDAGPIAGIAAALAHSTQPHLLVLAVDLPRVPLSLLQTLSTQIDANTGVVPEGPNGFEPLCAIYPNTPPFRALLDAELAAGRHALQSLLRTAIAAGLMRSFPIEPKNLPLFANWNTPADRTSKA